MCGRAFNTSNSGSRGSGFKPRPSRSSLDKKLYSTLSLFTQVYIWIPATYCLRVNLRWTIIPFRGGVAILLSMLHARETGISSDFWAFGSCGPLPYLFNSQKLWNCSWCCDKHTCIAYKTIPEDIGGIRSQASSLRFVTNGFTCGKWFIG